VEAASDRIGERFDIAAITGHDRIGSTQGANNNRRVDNVCGLAAI
jgi:hypothetical protein